MSKPASPFKFLDAYGYGDLDLFFGRDAEIEQLYRAVSGVKHLLLYGPSGVGKTSLIECGLRNQFSDADWFALTIRRGSHLLRSLYASINAELSTPLNLDPSTGLPTEGENTIRTAVSRLFNQRFQPIYLLFDQFEELLLLGSEAEKIAFFKTLNELIHFKIPCKMILVMREEFIGHLSEFEQHCPTVFQHRFRLEKMGRRQVGEVIAQTLTAPQYESQFIVRENTALAAGILECLPDKTQQIELTYVQVFLNKLWQRAMARIGEGDTTLPLLDDRLIREDDRLSSVLHDFLIDQLKALEPEFGQRLPLEVLAALITEQHSKLLLSEAELREDMELKDVAGLDRLSELLQTLQARRMLRSLRWGETSRYEIAHDLLARVVGENLTDEIKMREKARNLYRFYQERTAPLTIEDIDHLRALQTYQQLPKGLSDRIETEETRILGEQARALAEAQEQAAKEQTLRTFAESKARTAKKRTVVALVLLGIACVAAWLAYRSRQAVKTEKMLVLDKNFALQWANARSAKVEGNYEEGVVLLQALEKDMSDNTYPMDRWRTAEYAAKWNKIAVLTDSAGVYEQELVRYDSAVSKIEQALQLDPDERLEERLQQLRADWYQRELNAIQSNELTIQERDSWITNIILANNLASDYEQVLEDLEKNQ